MIIPTTTTISDHLGRLAEAIHEAHWCGDALRSLKRYHEAVDIMTALHALHTQGGYWFSHEEILGLMRMNEEIAEGIVAVREKVDEIDDDEWQESS